MFLIQSRKVEPEITWEELEGLTTEYREYPYGSDWDSEEGANEFGSEEEAEKAIEELKSMGEEWASWEYRVVEYK